ncbi:hypothetical protein Scep_000279 [Stephania cephalantha]|uniref:Heparan-alpha-glucosaminide N-acetyltransferase catalytic domain-containing protein n=1 Tax=Stephania cephalantha TaxID=152367 RepID=A0AAP0L5U6_9MAGN
MADHHQLVPLIKPADADEDEANSLRRIRRTNARLASLDVFRGLSVLLMIFVDYAGPLFPLVAHSPWNGVSLADFVMPYFLFIVGVSLALAYKRVTNRLQATCKALQRTAELFLFGVLLQGGYFHGTTSLTFGVDIESIRCLGILQRISVGYMVAALCEIWLTSRKEGESTFFKGYYLHGCFAFALAAIYLGLLYGLYVPDWQFRAPDSTSSSLLDNDHIFYKVKCGVRGDLGPACNSARMIDRRILGLNHLYRMPAYKNLEVCTGSDNFQVLKDAPPWCHAPFDPEGILSSFPAAITSIIGLHYGHVLVRLESHQGRLFHWLLFSVPLFCAGLILNYLGMPLNKSLYSMSYMLLTSASAGITLSVLYIVVDIYGYRRLTYVLEWMGIHSLSLFILVSSNLAVIFIQGFYWVSPENNIIHWIISLVRR